MAHSAALTITTTAFKKVLDKVAPEGGIIYIDGRIVIRRKGEDREIAITQPVLEWVIEEVNKN